MAKSGGPTASRPADAALTLAPKGGWKPLPPPCTTIPPPGPPPISKSDMEGTGPKSKPAPPKLLIPNQVDWDCAERPRQEVEQEHPPVLWRVPKASITPNFRQNSLRDLQLGAVPTVNPTAIKATWDTESGEDQENRPANQADKWMRLPAHMKLWDGGESTQSCENLSVRKQSVITIPDSESDTGHHHTQDENPQETIFTPSMDTPVQPDPSSQYSTHSDPNTSQGDSSLPASQNTQEPRMTAQELADLLKVIPTLPHVFRDLLLESKLLARLPRNIFDASLAKGSYTRYNQIMGGQMRDQEPHLLREFMRYDLQHLKGFPDINTHKARIYMYKKYGISNREAMVLLGCRDMAEALGNKITEPKERTRPRPKKRTQAPTQQWVESQRSEPNKNASEMQGGQPPTEQESARAKEVEREPKRSKHNRCEMSEDIAMKVSGSEEETPLPLAYQKEQSVPNEKAEQKLNRNETAEQAPFPEKIDHSLRKPSEGPKVKKDKCGDRPTVKGARPPKVSIPQEKATHKKWTDKGDRNMGTLWEVIDGALCFRSGIAGQTPQDQTSDRPCPDGLPGSSTDTPLCCPQTNPSQPTEQDPTGSHTEDTAQSEEGYSQPRFLTCPLQDIQDKKTQSQVISLVHEINSQSNNLTDREKLCLREMRGQHRFSQKAEYTNPEARKLYRCGLDGCTATLNPNGIERAVRSHVKKFHKKPNTSYFITINKHDKSQIFVSIGAVKPKPTAKPKPAPKEQKRQKPTSEEKGDRTFRVQERDGSHDTPPTTDERVVVRLTFTDPNPRPPPTMGEDTQSENRPHNLQAPVRQTGRPQKNVQGDNDCDTCDFELDCGVDTPNHSQDPGETEEPQQSANNPVADPNPTDRQNAQMAHRSLLGMAPADEAGAFDGQRLPSSDDSDGGDKNEAIPSKMLKFPFPAGYVLLGLDQERTGFFPVWPYTIS